MNANQRNNKIITDLSCENKNLKELNKELTEVLEKALKYMKEFGCTDQLTFDHIESAIAKSKSL